MVTRAGLWVGQPAHKMPPYDDSADSGAADQLEADSENQQPEAEDNSFYLPGDFPGAENLKAGDMISLKVVGKDKDGDIEVQHMPDDEEGGQPKPKPGMMDSFDKEVT